MEGRLKVLAFYFLRWVISLNLEFSTLEMAARSRFGLKPIRTFQEGFTIYSLLEALDTDDDNEGEKQGQ